MNVNASGIQCCPKEGYNEKFISNLECSDANQLTDAEFCTCGSKFVCPNVVLGAELCTDSGWVF